MDSFTIRLCLKASASHYSTCTTLQLTGSPTQNTLLMNCSRKSSAILSVLIADCAFLRNTIFHRHEAIYYVITHFGFWKKSTSTEIVPIRFCCCLGIVTGVSVTASRNFTPNHSLYVYVPYTRHISYMYHTQGIYHIIPVVRSDPLSHGPSWGAD